MSLQVQKIKQIYQHGHLLTLLHSLVNTTRLPNHPRSRAALCYLFTAEAAVEFYGQKEALAKLHRTP